MAFYLGIDAGGTKAEYALANDDMIVARAKSNSIKRMRVDCLTAASNLHSALSQLETVSGVPMSQISATCVGIAGETVPLVTDWLKDEFRKYFMKSLLIKGDVEIALEAAFPGLPGILVLAGTGSHVVGRSTTGETFSAGGYGPVLSDQGSGHSIGVNALRAMFLARDKDHKTKLFGKVMAHWNLASVTDLVTFANTCPLNEFSRLAPIVISCAMDGDEVANAVLEDEARQLSQLVVQVARKLRGDEKRVNVSHMAFAGSVLLPGLFRERLLLEIQRELPDIAFIDMRVDPVAGALAFARRSVELGRQPS